MRFFPPLTPLQYSSVIVRSVPISEVSSYNWVKNHKHFLAQSPNYREMLIVDPETNETHAPRPGEIYKNPYLASVFRDLAEQGKKGFYEGRVAEAIVERSSSFVLPPSVPYSRPFFRRSHPVEGRCHDPRRPQEPHHDSRHPDQGEFASSSSVRAHPNSSFGRRCTTLPMAVRVSLSTRRPPTVKVLPPSSVRLLFTPSHLDLFLFTSLSSKGTSHNGTLLTGSPPSSSRHHRADATTRQS